VKGGQFKPAKLRNLKRRRGGTFTGISTQGAIAIVKYATLGKKSVTGKFFSGKVSCLGDDFENKSLK
jgi:hypothetical protein